jgi:phosphatidylglycerophosphate synthase
MARGVTANAITVASIVLGLAAALAIASDGLAGAVLGLVLYAVAVVLDHADGEVARLAFAESAFGEWLDIGGDTLVHAALVLGMGVTAERLAEAGAAMGVVAAAGVVASAWVAKTAPPAANAINRAFGALGNRDGFYAMLLAFVLGVALAPSALPALMVLVAAGTHAYWIGSSVTRPRG